MNATPDSRGALCFLMRNPAYVRNFESVLRALAARGHRVTVLFEEHKDGGDAPGLALIGALCAEHPSLSYEFGPPMRLGFLGTLRKALRMGQDYLRYFDPPYQDAALLRRRAAAFLPRRIERAIAAAMRRSPWLRHRLAGTARRLDRRLGVDRHVFGELERRAPSALIVTPLVDFGSRQNSWVSAARRLGIGTVLCLHGWDNLTNRGLIHVLPDRIAVWNDAQREQAIALHGAERESVTVTGAWPYDHWFGWRPSRPRAALCRQLGLDPERPTILYACSSRFIAEGERDAVSRWIGALRAAGDPRLAEANVIVRPHPLNRDEWLDPARVSTPGVTIFPANGADPVSEASRADYFDSITHADAVVGINTSALIESAIVDRPALAFPAPEFRSSQEELPHFRELIGEEGAVRVSGSMAEHFDQLARLLADPAHDAAGRKRFVERFIRPGGDAASPTKRVVAEIEGAIGSAVGGQAGASRAGATIGA